MTLEDDLKLFRNNSLKIKFGLNVVFKRHFWIYKEKKFTAAVSHKCKFTAAGSHKCKFIAAGSHKCKFTAAGSHKCKSKKTQFRKAVSVVSSIGGNPGFKTLAWEPSAVQVTKSFSRHLPALEQFYRESQNQAKNISVGLPYPGLTWVRCIQFLLFETKHVLVYNSTIFKLTILFILYIFVHNVYADKTVFKKKG